jgi:hypothetical protein
MRRCEGGVGGLLVIAHGRPPGILKKESGTDGTRAAFFFALYVLSQKGWKLCAKLKKFFSL